MALLGARIRGIAAVSLLRTQIIRTVSSSSSGSYDHSYASTLLLPHTKFPMRSNAAEREPSLIADVQQLYKKQEEQNTGPLWITHDGPPYANGDLHMGHFMNKVLKDIVNRYKMMRGHRVSFIPGWDCHGLPIEIKALENLKKMGKEPGKMSPQEIRAKARSFALAEVEKQKKSFTSWGVLGDWANPYLTLDPKYEAAQLSLFLSMYKKGLIYRGVKPVHWSPSSKTALAEAELEYNDHHVSPSVYVKFPLVTPTQKASLSRYKNCSAIIWTTTPWTLPANAALCVNPDLQYCILGASNGEHYIIAQERVSFFLELMGCNISIVASIKGQDLEGTVFQHPFMPTKPSIICGHHVTTLAGTGIVHTAPGHGEDDFEVGRKYDLPIMCPVDENGAFTDEAGQQLVGKFVLKGGNETVITMLNESGALLKKENYTHKYPYDWRTKQPIIVRTTRQWFVDVTQVKNAAEKAIDNTQMVPEVGRARLSSMIRNRNSWCISRQRAWGVPIPVFYNKHTDEPLITQETIDHVKKLVQQYGSDCWWNMTEKELLPVDMKSEDYIKGQDHKGQKMAKSLGNVIPPCAFISGAKEQKRPAYGVDVLRAFVASSDYTKDVSVGDTIIQQVHESMKKLRNTLRFMLGNTHDFDESKTLSYASLCEVEQYILYKTFHFVEQVTSFYDSYAFAKVFKLLMAFCAELSSFYFDVVKMRLYADAATSQRRRSTQTVLNILIEVVNKTIGPFAPHLSEEVFQNWTSKNENRDIFFLSGWIDLKDEWNNSEVAKKWDLVTALRDEVNKHLENARSQKIIGRPEEAGCSIYTKDKNFYDAFGSLGEELSELLLVSSVDLSFGLAPPNFGAKVATLTSGDVSGDVEILISKATQAKCPRCWRHQATAPEQLCNPCQSVLGQAKQ